MRASDVYNFVRNIKCSHYFPFQMNGIENINQYNLSRLIDINHCRNRISLYATVKSVLVLVHQSSRILTYIGV